MDTVTLEVSSLVTDFLDNKEMQLVLETEAKRLWHCWRSRELSPREKELRLFLGKTAYNHLSYEKHERMLACVEVPSKRS